MDVQLVLLLLSELQLGEYCLHLKKLRLGNFPTILIACIGMYVSCAHCMHFYIVHTCVLCLYVSW